MESDASLVENLRTFSGSRATRDQWDSRERARIMRETLLVPNCTSTFLARTGESRDMLGAAFSEVLYCHVRTVPQMITWQLPVMARLVKKKWSWQDL